MTKSSAADAARIGEEARFWVRSLVYTQSRQEAVNALLRLGPAALPTLKEALTDQNNRVREEVAIVLKQLRLTEIDSSSKSASD
jgi:HEAT repeat protein